MAGMAMLSASLLEKGGSESGSSTRSSIASSSGANMAAEWGPMPIVGLRRSSFPSPYSRKRVLLGGAFVTILGLCVVLRRHTASASTPYTAQVVPDIIPSSSSSPTVVKWNPAGSSSTIHPIDDDDQVPSSLSHQVDYAYTDDSSNPASLTACPISIARTNPNNVQPPRDLDDEHKLTLATMWSELQHSFEAHAPVSGWRGAIDAQNAQQTRDAHKAVIDRLLNYPANNIFNGRGVVMFAGARYSGYAATALGMLRESGSKLPVELWFKDQDDETPGWCDELAREGIACRRLSDYNLEAPSPGSIGSRPPNGYLYKPLAMLFSSFEEVLFLDADNFAISNPDALFDSKAYAKHGAILWPDYWRHSGSDWLPFVAGIRDTPSALFFDEQTVESGQIVWNKQRHWKSLLLAIYYNSFGPEYYYDLITGTSAPGWGDKDTFPLALRALGESYHFASRAHTAFFTNTTRIAGILQADPSAHLHPQQAARPISAEADGSTSSSDSETSAQLVTPPPRPRPLLFFHACMAKWSLDDLLRTGVDGFLDRWWYYLRHWASYGAATRTARALVGSNKRVLWQDDMVQLYGIDPEPTIWKAIEHTACRSPAWAELPLCKKTRKYMAKTFGLQTRKIGKEMCVLDT